MYRAETLGQDAQWIALGQKSYKIIEDETGNRVATLVYHPQRDYWWAWDWYTGEALLRGDFAGDSLEVVMSEADNWI